MPLAKLCLPGLDSLSSQTISPTRFFSVIKFWTDKTSGVARELNTGVPTYQVEDEEGRTHLLIHLPIEEEHEHRWCLWRPDHAGFDSKSIFEGALIEE